VPAQCSQDVKHAVDRPIREPVAHADRRDAVQPFVLCGGRFERRVDGSRSLPGRLPRPFLASRCTGSQRRDALAGTRAVVRYSFVGRNRSQRTTLMGRLRKFETGRSHSTLIRRGLLSSATSSSISKDERTGRASADAARGTESVPCNLSHMMDLHGANASFRNCKSSPVTGKLA
jgi:hypothetical protein